MRIKKESEFGIGQKSVLPLDFKNQGFDNSAKQGSDPINSHALPCSICTEKCEGLEELLNHISEVHGKGDVAKTATRRAGTRKSAPGLRKGNISTVKRKTAQRDCTSANVDDDANTVPSSEKYACDQCGKHLHSHRALMQHLTLHTGTKPHKCPLCERTFTRKDSIGRHIAVAHSDHPPPRPDNPLKCIDCYKKFDTLEEKEQHNCPVIDKRPFVCFYCGKHFSITDKLRDHVVSKHIDYRVNEDGRIDTAHNNSDLVWYIRQLIRCKKCNLVFQRPINRKTHIRKKMCKNLTNVPKDGLNDGEGDSLSHDEAETANSSNALLENANINGKPYAADDLGIPERDASYIDRIEHSSSYTAIYTTKSRSIRKLQRLKGEHTPNQEPDSSNHEMIEFLNELFRRSSKLKIYKCQYCDSSFTNMFSLERHERSVHTGEKPYLCDICAEPFYTKVHLRSHMQVHVKKKEEKCEICGKSFLKLISLRRHMSGHTGQGSFTCEVCGRGFADKSDLKRHSKRHSAEKDIICEICGKGFVEKGNYTSHLEWAHTEERSECHICGAVCKNKKCLKKHINAVHVLKATISCVVCGKMFKTQGYLTHHMISHRTDRPYKCSYCPKTFARPQGRQIHERIHTGYKPYTCEFCGKKSSDVANHIKHKRIHQNK